MSYRLKILKKIAKELEAERNKIKKLIDFNPICIFEKQKEAITEAKRLKGKAALDYLDKAMKEEKRLQAIWNKQKKIGLTNLINQFVDIEAELTDAKNMIFHEEGKYNRQ